MEFRIVGMPMSPWHTAMPKGMCLKSEGFASTLFEPSSQFTLGAYCAEQNIPYKDIGLPVDVDTFIKYGQAFQARFVPNLELRTVVEIEAHSHGFRAALQDGDTIDATCVVLASGILPFGYTPPELAELPKSVCSHSSEHHEFAQFDGREVVVVGAGASAMDTAAALRECGARVTVVTRRSSVRFQTPLGERSLFERLRAPMTPVGPGWKSVLCTKAPLLFHLMPDAFRTDVVRRYLGPAPAWFTREAIEEHVPILAEATIIGATSDTGRVSLRLRRNGSVSTIAADHVIAATGYKVDIRRLDFLHSSLRSSVRSVDGSPRLSLHFESSIRGLYFIGTTSANSFGPMLRFAYGAGFAARRLSRHLARNARVPLPWRTQLQTETVATGN
jgi:thioredoxin reductase